MGDMLLETVEKTAGLIAGAKRIVVFTGAGASTESGIPDFRSPGGIWSRFDPEEFTIYRFLASAETRLKQWRLLIESGLIVNAQPNQAHLAVAELEPHNTAVRRGPHNQVGGLAAEPAPAGFAGRQETGSSQEEEIP